MIPAPYTRAADLGELERIAYMANDRATLAMIELAEDACGVEAERVRERRADKLCDARGVTDIRAERAEHAARVTQYERKLQDARELESIARLILRPYVGKDKLPKWAATLRATLRRIAASRGES